MRAKTPTLVLLLSLTFLAALPSPLVRVQAVPQAGPTSWSPYGPQIETLLINVYADFQAMFSAFTAGQVDITDWPVNPGDVGPFGANPNFLLTDSEGEFGMFQLDINSHHQFLGKLWQEPRPAFTTGLVGSPTSTSSGVCTVGSGTNRFIVSLVNAEAGNAGINDPLNKVVATHTSGSPSATVAGTLANNQYTTPCLLAGGYSIKTTVYKGTGSVGAIGPGNDISVTLQVGYNSDSNRRGSASGTAMGRMLGHLLDKPNFMQVASLQGLAEFIDIPAAPAQGLVPCPPGTPGGCGNNLSGGVPTASKLPQSILDEDKTSHSWFGGSVISAYNLHNDAVGGVWWGANGAAVGANLGYSGPEDIRAACEHGLEAGFSIANGTCQDLGNISVGGTTPSCAQNLAAYTCPRLTFSGGKNQVIIYPRTDPKRRDFGTIFADSIDLLFGTPNNVPNNAVTRCVVNYGYLSPDAANGCTSKRYTIGQIADIVFTIDQPGGSPPGQNTVDDWDLYTGGFFLGSTPDHLWSLYNSDFTGGTALGGCAGTPVGDPNDYVQYCNPAYDGDTNAGQFSATLNDANAFFGRATANSHRAPNLIPVLSLASRFVALNGWNFQPGPQSSLVGVLGHGFQSGYSSLLNMRQVPGYVPPNPVYTPGGGDPELIRRGFSQEVHKLSLFHALTVWDFEVIGQIYESLLSVNPRTGGAGSQVVDWMTTSHSSTFSATEVCNDKDGVPFTGCTTQTWKLRNDIKFHNGAPVTADDVCFSLLAYRDVPAANYAAAVSTISSCRVINAQTVVVKHIQQSAFYELNTGGLAIIPATIWGSICSWPGALHDSTTLPPAATLQASTCGDPAFDPMQAGIMTGSGPWACISGGGNVGGPCSSNGTQDLALGDTVALSRNDNFVRCCPNKQQTSLDKISWADKDDNGVVNILDIADAALRFGVDDAYWDHELFGVTSSVVDIGEIATVAFYFDHGITKPFAPSALTSMDSRVDPYGAGARPGRALPGPLVATDDTIYYKGVSKTSSTVLHVDLYYWITEVICIRYTWTATFVYEPGDVLVVVVNTVIICYTVKTIGETEINITIPAAPGGTTLAAVRSELTIATGPTAGGPFSANSPILDGAIEAAAPFP